MRPICPPLRSPSSSSNARQSCCMRCFNVSVEFRHQGTLLIITSVSSQLPDPWSLKVWHLILLQGVVYGIAGGFLYSPYIIWVRMIIDLRETPILTHLNSYRNGLWRYASLPYLLCSHPDTEHAASILGWCSHLWRMWSRRGDISPTYDIPLGKDGISLDAPHLERNLVAPWRARHLGNQASLTGCSSIAPRSCSSCGF